MVQCSFFCLGWGGGGGLWGLSRRRLVMKASGVQVRLRDRLEQGDGLEV